jgi:hypothetical protein
MVLELATTGYTQNVQSFSLSAGVAFEFFYEIDTALYSSAGGTNQAWSYIGLVGTSKSLCLNIGIYQMVAGVNSPAMAVSNGTQTTLGSIIGAVKGCSAVPRFCKFGYDGTNLYVSTSADGFRFKQFYSEVYSSGVSFGGASVTGIVIGAYSGGTSYNGDLAVDFIRKTV